MLQMIGVHALQDRRFREVYETKPLQIIGDSPVRIRPGVIRHRDGSGGARPPSTPPLDLHRHLAFRPGEIETPKPAREKRYSRSRGSRAGVASGPRESRRMPLRRANAGAERHQYVLHLILGCLVPHLEGNHRPGVSMQMSLGSPLTVLVVRVHARAGQFRCTRDLGGGHVVFDCVPPFPGDFGPIGTRDVEPHVR